METKLNRLLTSAEVAALLNVKIQTLAIWRCAGRGPAFVKVGSKIGYAPESIAAWTAAHTRNSTVEPAATVG